MGRVMIKPEVYWVGVKDWSRKIFDSLIPLPVGTSYNSYLVKGREKTALIDTVNPGFEAQLLSNLAEATDPAQISYLIMNHAEPDHASAIPVVMAVAKKAVLVTTKQGAEMAKVMHRAPEDRIKIVKDGEAIELGGKTLRFIEAPWLHWPETMFTYLLEDQVLFPCDFMGLHTASALYDDEVEELIPLAKSYFGEIMMPFRKMGAKALEKIKDLPLELIAPSHGPIHKNTERILSAYRKWTAGETREKVIIAYVSMWQSTETMVRAMVDALLKEGLEVVIHNLAVADLADLARDLVDSRAIVLGAPTVLGGLHPAAIYAATLVKALRPPLKYGAVLSSYGWGGGAVKQALEILGPTGLELAGAVEVKGPPASADLAQVAELGRALAKKIKGGTVSATCREPLGRTTK